MLWNREWSGRPRSFYCGPTSTGTPDDLAEHNVLKCDQEPLMNEITFSCPRCSVLLTVDETESGTVVPCPNCQNQIAIPVRSTDDGKKGPAADEAPDGLAEIPDATDRQSVDAFATSEPDDAVEAIKEWHAQPTRRTGWRVVAAVIALAVVAGAVAYWIHMVKTKNTRTSSLKRGVQDVVVAESSFSRARDFNENSQPANGSTEGSSTSEVLPVADDAVTEAVGPVTADQFNAELARLYRRYVSQSLSWVPDTTAEITILRRLSISEFPDLQKFGSYVYEIGMPYHDDTSVVVSHTEYTTQGRAYLYIQKIGRSPVNTTGGFTRNADLYADVGEAAVGRKSSSTAAYKQAVRQQLINSNTVWLFVVRPESVIHIPKGDKTELQFQRLVKSQLQRLTFHAIRMPHKPDAGYVLVPIPDGTEFELKDVEPADDGRRAYMKLRLHSNNYTVDPDKTEFTYAVRAASKAASTSKGTMMPSKGWHYVVRLDVEDGEYNGTGVIVSGISELMDDDDIL
jgi:hypothetical protein